MGGLGIFCFKVEILVLVLFLGAIGKGVAVGIRDSQGWGGLGGFLFPCDFSGMVLSAGTVDICELDKDVGNEGKIGRVKMGGGKMVSRHFFEPCWVVVGIVRCMVVSNCFDKAKVESGCGKKCVLPRSLGLDPTLVSGLGG